MIEKKFFLLQLQKICKYLNSKTFTYDNFTLNFEKFAFVSSCHFTTIEKCFFLHCNRPFKLTKWHCMLIKIQLHSLVSSIHPIRYVIFTLLSAVFPESKSCLMRRISTMQYCQPAYLSGSSLGKL